jgi:hypothetical protein
MRGCSVHAVPGWSQADEAAQILLALGLRDGVTCAIADKEKVCGITHIADLLLTSMGITEREQARFAYADNTIARSSLGHQE